MIAWPRGARSAVVLTFNLDAELFWLRLDESVARRPKTLSIGTYGVRRGLPRVLERLESAGVRGSWFVPAGVAERHPDAVAVIAAGGHELAARDDGLAPLGADQRAVLERAAAALERCGVPRPVGFRPVGDVSDDTADMLSEVGYEWCSVTRGEDRPLFLESDGGPTGIVDLPRPWELYDAPYFLFNYGPPFPAGQCRVAGYARVLEDWRRELDAYHAEGLCCVLSLDPQAIGTPGRIGILEGVLEHLAGRDDVWLATGAEVAAFWREHGPENAPETSERVRRSSRP